MGLKHGNRCKTKHSKIKKKKKGSTHASGEGERGCWWGEVDSGEEDYGSLKRDKSVRPPVRRKRNKDISPILEEDIIDGFAILAFKTYEDLEFAIKIASKRNEKRLSSIIELTKLMADENINDILSKSQKSNPAIESKPLARDESDQKGKISNYINQNAYCQDAGTSDDSGRASERLTTSSVAQRDAESSRDRLSDASSRCSSGKGYICDSEGDDDKVSDAGSGFSNTHPFTASKSSKSNSTPPLLVDHVSTNSTNNLECITAKTDLMIDQKVAMTELPPPALPSPLSSTTNTSTTTPTPIATSHIDKVNQVVQNIQVPSRIDEKSNIITGDNKNDPRNTQATSLIPGLVVKTEEVPQVELGPQTINNVEIADTKVALNIEPPKETHQHTNNSSTEPQKRESEQSFGPGPIKVIKHDPATIPDAGPSPFLYRSPYAQGPPGFPNYPYPVPPAIDTKDKLSPSPNMNNKMAVPHLPVSSVSKDNLLQQPNKTDKNPAPPLSLNPPPKERDNFSDIDSLSVSSVTSSNTAVVQSLPSSKIASSTFPRPMPTPSWPISTSQPEVPIIKPSISGSSGAKSTPPPPTSISASSNATSNTTFATPLPPPTTSAPLSFSAESLFSTKPKDQTDLLRRELDSRFLDRAGLSSSSSSNPPYLRQELHHHQHQHTHLHQHHQQIIPAVNQAAPSTLFSAPLFKDIPKIGGVDSPFYRTGISMPMYTAYPQMLHPSMGAATTQFIPQNSLSSFIPKKTGRWNAMHVRIAWEIYSHQTKQNPEKANPLKATEVLRNPSHLHASASAGGLLRTHEMMPGSYGPPHLIAGRNIFDSSMNPQFLTSSSHLGMSPFSRYNSPFPPSPFASMSGYGRDSGLAPPFTGLHDPWRSLQRPYLPSPAPPNWAMKPDVSNIEISKREAEERERQLRDREERERLRREREEKERQRERDREREEKLKKEAERERKEKEKREQERREMERERMLQQQRMNDMKPNVQNNVICHDRSPMRNGCEPDMRIKEESRKDEDVLRNDPSRYSSSSNPIMGNPSHAYLSSRHPPHVLGVNPSHLSRSILPHPGSSLSHFPPPPPSVWSGVDPYPYRLDPMTPLRYNPLMESVMRAEEERAKAMYVHSALHYRPKDPASFPMMHHRMPPQGAPLNSMKPNGPPHIPPVNSDALKKDDSSQNR